MTERKPRGVPFETWVERKIREAQERGEFDHLPGAGKPIPGLRGVHDPYWWIKDLLKREHLSVTPRALELHKELEQARERIRAQASESAVRRVVAELNSKIAEFNRSVTAGPPSDLAPLDADAVVRDWRDRRAGGAAERC